MTAARRNRRAGVATSHRLPHAIASRSADSLAPQRHRAPRMNPELVGGYRTMEIVDWHERKEVNEQWHSPST